MMITPIEEQEARARCTRIRARIISLSYHAKSAHLGSSLSCVEILDAVYASLKRLPKPESQTLRHRVVLSKGHAAMAYYATLEQFQLLPPSMLDSYLHNGTQLWGHVTLTEAVPEISASSGSLGHGLPIAAGFALAATLAKRPELRSFAIISDGECDEGSTWEAVMFAGARKLDSLTALVDYNHIQSIGTTHDVLELEPFADKWRAFGWDVCECDGHDWPALMLAINTPSTGKPRAILAHTVKGKGIARIENTVASHYKPALESDVLSPVLVEG